MRKDIIILLVIAVAVVGIGALLFAKYNPEKVSTPGPRPSDALLTKPKSHAIGPQSAKVTIVEFGDFQCPACAYVNPIVNQVIAKYKSTGKFQFVYRNFPLTQIHKNALLSAQAAEAAGAQGKYWEMHDKLFETQKDWSESDKALDFFTALAQNLGLDANRFKESLKNREFLPAVQADAADAESLNLPGTPSFFINGQEQQNIPSFDGFVKLIDAELNK